MDERIKDKNLPAPGNWDFVNMESVVALKPDLVILWSNQTESIGSLEERGIPVYGVFIKGKKTSIKKSGHWENSPGRQNGQRSSSLYQERTGPFLLPEFRPPD